MTATKIIRLGPAGLMGTVVLMISVKAGVFSCTFAKAASLLEAHGCIYVVFCLHVALHGFQAPNHTSQGSVGGGIRKGGIFLACLVIGSLSLFCRTFRNTPSQSELSWSYIL